MHVTTMEAMTTMGMAASQARFLGLTARKSNVEYQGQQVNQQRTALANESANLYTQMMDLTVPTPPSTSNYYKTTYVLENSTTSDSKTNYQITNATKTYSGIEGEYRVTLATTTGETEAGSFRYKLNNVAYKDGAYSLDFIKNGTGATPSTVTFKPNEVNAFSGENNSLSVKTNQIYKANSRIEGYALCCPSATKEDGSEVQYYFYNDGKDNHFMTEDQLQEMISLKQNEDGEYINEYASIGEFFPLSNTYVINKTSTTEVLATMETASSGRYSSIHIYDYEHYPSELAGNTFTISTTQVMDENAYNDAYNDYEYEKYLYEKAVSDINAKTEIVQREDQQLELRLDQLDTEQNAIATEMDSVTKVIEDNVEKTFKIFA